MTGGWLLSALVVVVLVACGTSALTVLVLPWWDRLAARVAPRTRARLWLWLAQLPLWTGLLALFAALLPALGVGFDDCLAHGKQLPHLCWVHTVPAPATGCWWVVGLVLVRLGWVLYTLAHTGRLSHRTAGTLQSVSNRYADGWVFHAARPQAFVLRMFRPRLYLSKSLLAMGPAVVEPVLSHERAHMERRDPLWRWAFPLLAVGHLPLIASQLYRRLMVAQEMAADAESAEAHGPLQVAEALLCLAKSGLVGRLGLAFTEGDVSARVRALLEPGPVVGPWPVRLLLGLGASCVGAMLLGYQYVHQGLESILGLLA